MACCWPWYEQDVFSVCLRVGAACVQILMLHLTYILNRMFTNLLFCKILYFGEVVPYLMIVELSGVQYCSAYIHTCNTWKTVCGTLSLVTAMLRWIIFWHIIVSSFVHIVSCFSPYFLSLAVLSSPSPSLIYTLSQSCLTSTFSCSASWTESCSGWWWNRLTCQAIALMGEGAQCEPQGLHTAQNVPDSE